MALIPIGDQLSLSKKRANLDVRFGPYDSVSGALDEIEDTYNAIVPGLRFGVYNGNGCVSTFEIAEVDEDGNAVVRPTCVSLIPFAGVVEDATVNPNSSAEPKSAEDVYFVKSRGVFVFKTGETLGVLVGLHNAINGRMWYDENFKPYKDILYLDMSEGKIYAYNDGSFVTVGGDGGNYDSVIETIKGNIERVGGEAATADAKAVEAMSKANEVAAAVSVAATKDELTAAVEQLTGLEGSNFLGIFDDPQLLGDAIHNSGKVAGWGLVGTDISALEAWNITEFNASQNLVRIGDKTYDFTDYTEVKEKMDRVYDKSVEKKTNVLSQFIRIRKDNGDVVIKITENGIGATSFDFIDSNGNKVGEVAKNEEKKLKIIIIGNSYSRDSWCYVPFILKSYGINVKIGIVYYSGNYTEREANDYSTATSGYQYNEIDTSVNAAWGATQTGKTIQQWIKSDTWDIVVLQQGSTKSTSIANYIPSVTNLMNKIVPDLSKPTLFGWNINHTRQTADDKEAVLECCKKMYDSQGINIIFPYGTAIFNARTNTALTAIGDLTNFWQDSNGHLQEGLPCYTAALANVQALFNKFYPQYSVIGNKTRPNDSWVSEKNIIETHGNCVGINDANCLLAQRYAVSAVNNPFTINSMQ